MISDGWLKAAGLGKMRSARACGRARRPARAGFDLMQQGSQVGIARWQAEDDFGCAASEFEQAGGPGYHEHGGFSFKADR
jgi:hypothetical protein